MTKRTFDLRVFFFTRQSHDPDGGFFFGRQTQRHSENPTILSRKQSMMRRSRLVHDAGARIRIAMPCRRLVETECMSRYATSAGKPCGPRLRPELTENRAQQAHWRIPN